MLAAQDGRRWRVVRRVCYRVCGAGWSDWSEAQVFRSVGEAVRLARRHGHEGWELKVFMGGCRY